MNMKRILSAGVLLAAIAGVLPAQSPQPVPKTSDPIQPLGIPLKAKTKSALEEALEQALKNNPDLKVAQAKVIEAEAEAARARAQVVQKVVAAYQNIEQAKAGVQTAQANLERIKTMYAQRAGGAASGDVEAAVPVVAQAKAKLAAAEAELNYLTGKDPTRTTTEDRLKGERFEYYRAIRQLNQLSGAGGGGGPAPKGDFADRLRKALEKKSSFKFNNITAAQMLEGLQKETGGLHIHASGQNHPAWQEKVNATLTDVTLAAAFHFLEDTLGSHRIVVRDYGLLVVPQEKVPPGAVTLGKFLESKAEPSATTTPAPKPGTR